MNFFVKFFNLTSEQRERLSKNVLSIVSLNFFQIISQILFPPLMILIWGVDKFGLILFLIALPAGLSFLNINYTPSARQEMALAKSRGNAKDLNTIFNSTILLVLLSVFLYTVVIIIWSKFFNFNLEIFTNFDKNEIKLFIIFVFLSFYLKFFDSIVSLAITYTGKIYLDINISTSCEVILKVCLVVLGFFTSSLVYLAITYFIISISKSLFYLFYYLKQNHNLSFSFNFTNKNVIKKNFYLSRPHYLNELCEKMRTSILVIILGIYFDLSVVTFFVTVRTLFYFFPTRIFGYIFSVSLQFDYANLYARNKILNLKAIHKKQILFNLLLCILFVIFSLILGPFIYSFWLNDKFHVNLTILSLIVFDAFFAVIKLNLVSVLQAINNWFRIIVFEFSFSIAVLIFSVIFFMNNYNYYVYFYLSLTGSFIILAYSFYELSKFYNKIES